MKRVLGIACIGFATYITAHVQFVTPGFSYDDVLLVPRKSMVASRKEGNVHTKFSKNITLAIPIVSANMDTVTEHTMAIAMAEQGGIGIIHRFNTIEQQVAEVRTVKEHCVCDTLYPHASRDLHGRLRVGAALGVKEDALARATALVEVGVDALVIDIAHGHCASAIALVQQLKRIFPDVDLVAGNVVTAEATRELIIAGADAIKVGIGPGSICTTRIITGCGFPQLSAIIACSHEADIFGIPIIADGGIRYSGDITKAIAAGASTVMLGNLLAGTDESPGVIITKDTKQYKAIKGMASMSAQKRYAYQRRDESYVADGVDALTLYKGSVADCLSQLVGGLRSGMSYCGAATLDQLRGNGIFVPITAAGVRESHVHDVERSAT